MERRGDRVSITDAPLAHSQELRGRQTRYLLSMLVRTLCFLAAVVASGPLRWVFIAGALFLPYIAVVLANAGSSRRTPQHGGFTPEPFGALEPAPEDSSEAPARPSSATGTG